MRRTPTAHIHLLIFLLFIITSSSLLAEDSWKMQTLHSWFRLEKKADRYSDKKGEIELLFNRAERSGIPPSLLMERLKEGAAKGVPPGRLVSALRSEKERLVTAQRHITEAGYLPEKQHLKLVSIYLRGGLSVRIIEHVLDLGRQENKDIDDVFLLFDALFQISKTVILSEDQLTTLGRVMLHSTLHPKSYASINSFFIKGRARRLDDREILRIIEEVLGNDGRLIQLDRELQRRAGRR